MIRETHLRVVSGASVGVIFAHGKKKGRLKGRRQEGGPLYRGGICVSLPTRSSFVLFLVTSTTGNTGQSGLGLDLIAER